MMNHKVLEPSQEASLDVVLQLGFSGVTVEPFCPHTYTADSVCLFIIRD